MYVPPHRSPATLLQMLLHVHLALNKLHAILLRHLHVLVGLEAQALVESDGGGEGREADLGDVALLLRTLDHLVHDAPAKAEAPEVLRHGDLGDGEDALGHLGNDEAAQHAEVLGDQERELPARLLRDLGETILVENLLRQLSRLGDQGRKRLVDARAMDDDVADQGGAVLPGRQGHDTPSAGSRGAEGLHSGGVVSKGCAAGLPQEELVREGLRVLAARR
mmetsp:Transcript_51241/g.123276  ORF Transcript_51241/g.123276 Transcript_51241/m.123276 type:complete len:221 (+) Transcript_51241:227-889(+)